MDRDGSGGDTSLDQARLCLAFLVRAGYDPPRVSERLGKRHTTVAMWAQQMISLVRRWRTSRSIKLMGDTAYSVLELGLHAKAQPVTLVTTGRLDAVRHSPPSECTRHTIGRPSVGGLRLPALEQVLQDPETVWQKLRLPWYGQGERTLEICTGTALWYRYGSNPLPLRSRPDSCVPLKPSFPSIPPRRQNRSKADEISRWSLKVTFEETLM